VSDNGHIVRCWRAGDGLPSPAAVRSEHAGHARSDALFIADHIVAAYGRGPTRSSAIRDVSFSVATGECLALVGESGSGKTTLGRCVVGLHSPAEGSFMLHGKTLGASVKERTRADRQAIQIVFQNPHRSLNPRERVGDAIQRPLRLFGMTDRVAMRRRAAGLLEQVRLSATALGRYPGELSGGEKQRVAIARALAANPLLLVCDEITSSLDVSTQAAILSLLEELRKDGLSLLFITHNLALVHSIADRVLVLQGGEMRDYGDTRMVMRQPSHPYVQELLAAAPDLSSVS
jgi:peptide/nickel transport system ATP-binding protein